MTEITDPRIEPATVERLLNGESLRVVLVPDPSQPHNFPEITESLELRHILIDRDKFWGITSPVHSSFGVVIDGEHAPEEPCFYAYSNYAGIVVNASPSRQYARVYRDRAYREMTFVAAPNYRLVWESGVDGNVGAVRAAVREGKKLKIAMLDHENYWNIDPVHRPIVATGNDDFELVTDYASYPLGLRLSANVLALEKRVNALFAPSEGEEDTGAGGMLIDNGGYHWCWRIATSDGRSRTAPGRGPFSSQDLVDTHYKTLKVFAEH